MTSIKLKFRPSRCLTKEGSLYLQLIHRRKVKQVSLNLNLFSKEWNKNKGQIIIDSKDEKRFHYLMNLREQVEISISKLWTLVRFLSEKGDFTVDELHGYYLNGCFSGYFSPYMESCIRKLRLLNRFKTASGYRCAWSSFMKFRGGKDIAFKMFNAALMKDYEFFLRSKEITLNTISFYMRILRSVYNKAVSEGLTEQKYPFRQVFTGVEQTTKRALDMETIVRLKKLDLSRSPGLGFARDLFMFSLYTRGMSFVDIAFLKKGDISDSFIHYKRRKTGQQLQVRVETCIMEIIERYESPITRSPYLLPILNPNNPRPIDIQYRNAICYQNKQLKKISVLLDLSIPLTSYMARHTWATMAHRRNIPIRVISESMGHHSESTTRIYLASLDQSDIDQANRLVLSYME